MSRYLDVEIDIAVERVAKRHAAAWKWPLERAFERANGSDRKNMELVKSSRGFADKTIKSVSISE
jgi:hypothetical protein